MDLKIIPLDYAEQMELSEMIGYPGQSRVRWQVAVTAASIREIDGREELKPTHADHLRFILQTVPDEQFKDAIRQVQTFREPTQEPPPEIEVRPLSTIETWDLSEYAGGFYDIASWNGLATIACSVRSFKGVKLDFPKDMGELRSRVKRLGWVGMDLANDYLMRLRRQKQDEPEPRTEGN